MCWVLSQAARMSWGDMDVILSSYGLQSNEMRETTDNKHIPETWRRWAGAIQNAKAEGGEGQGASLDSTVRKDAECDHGNET